MKNVTIALDEETYRVARIRAAELGTSVSAMVKAYLQGLETDPGKGVRDMAMTFAAQPAVDAASVPNPNNAPYFVNGQWVFTKDGKPRKPGALRHLPPLPDDWEEWGPEIEAFFEKLQTEEIDENPADWSQ